MYKHVALILQHKVIFMKAFEMFAFLFILYLFCLQVYITVSRRQDYQNINLNSLDNKGSCWILKDLYCSVTMLRELGLMTFRAIEIRTWKLSIYEKSSRHIDEQRHTFTLQCNVYNYNYRVNKLKIEADKRRWRSYVIFFLDYRKVGVGVIRLKNQKTDFKM